MLKKKEKESKDITITITTTPSLEGKTITEYLGIVSGCGIYMLPGGNKMIQAGWSGGVQEALLNMQEQANELSADAVVGLTVNAYKSGGYDYVQTTGTAVKLS